MVKTHGLTHISLAVKDPDRSLKFYTKVFGVKEYYRDEESIQVLGPGPHDVIAFLTASATLIASTAAFTSCTRTMCAPIKTEAATLAIVP